jgi:periplasmic iron binding protein
MSQRWIGPIVIFLILGGVASILLLNLNLKGTRSRDAGAPSAAPAQDQTSTTSRQRPAGFREYPIGDSVERHQMRIDAVWLPPVQMDGMPGPPPSDVIHIEADIKATAGNTNGCSKDEFIPYLTVHYTIVPEGPAAKSVEPIRRPMMPMVARDGWHYGASVLMPKAGRYKLTYFLEPPSAGRHVDPATGVDPWWKPFEVSFDWDYPGPP